MRNQFCHALLLAAAAVMQGAGQGYRLKDNRRQNPPFELNPPDRSGRRSLDLHRGGIIETPSGEWWGFSMHDHNSVGRLTSLSPVNWVDGWPYFGLPGNLKRSPSIWVKPNTGAADKDLIGALFALAVTAGPRPSEYLP
jgi:xylan 1,4-beta-xylosidase